MELPRLWMKQLVQTALLEDLGMGDVSLGAIEGDHLAQVSLLAKSPTLLAGMEFFWLALEEEGAEPKPEFSLKDGDWVEPGTEVTRFSALAKPCLRAERTGLNFLGHLSGIATRTKKLTEQLPPTIRLAATRKTTPGLRAAEKYAVWVGGGLTHRMRLDDMVLLKENHLRAAGGIGPAVKKVRQGLSHHLKVQVEVTNAQELEEAISAGADMVLMDNFRPDALISALSLVQGRINSVEVSGNISEENLTQYAVPGVDIISMGTLTGGSQRSDFSLLFDSGAP